MDSTINIITNIIITNIFTIYITIIITSATIITTDLNIIISVNSEEFKVYSNFMVTSSFIIQG